jgi:5-methylthioadenosine/S-adenosylhomocysteine deaminase
VSSLPPAGHRGPADRKDNSGSDTRPPIVGDAGRSTGTLRGRVVVADAGKPVLRDHVVELDGPWVVGVRPSREGDSGPIHDVLLPGLIDAHSHARAIRLDRQGVAAGPLERFLVMLRALTPLDPGDEALVAADAGLRAGITATQVSHHTFGEAESYLEHARAIATGYAQAGSRAFITLAFSDQDEYGPASLLADTAPEAASAIPQPQRGMDHNAFIAAAATLLDSAAGLGDAKARSAAVVFDGVGPIAPQWCSRPGNIAVGSIRAGGRVHAHLLESPWQRMAASLSDPLEVLADAALLGPWSSFAHGVWLGDHDRERLAQAGATIVNCPGSNIRTGSGRCEVRRLLEAGVNVALGIDSNSTALEPDPFAEMRLALETADELGAPLRPAEVLAMATTGGARALCRPDLGTLRPGSAADVIALELPEAIASPDPIDHIVRHARPEHVAARWIAGSRREPTGAAAARRRLESALDADTADRERRLAASGPEWQSVEQAWTTLRSKIQNAN